MRANYKIDLIAIDDDNGLIIICIKCRLIRRLDVLLLSCTTITARTRCGHGDILLA